jgi:hypothetical protein
MGRDEIGYSAAKDDAESFRVNPPSHDAERIGPKVFVGTLDLRRTAIDVGKVQQATSVDLDQILVRQWSAGELSELAADRERS